MKDMSKKNSVKLKYFGTDGFRGEYGKELTNKHAEAIGRFLGTYYGGREAEILIGHDTRASSALLEDALIRGITSSGGTAFRLGVCPTPAVSFMAKHGAKRQKQNALLARSMVHPFCIIAKHGRKKGLHTEKRRCIHRPHSPLICTSTC